MQDRSLRVDEALMNAKGKIGGKLGCVSLEIRNRMLAPVISTIQTKRNRNALCTSVIVVAGRMLKC